jgi:hypothetical protein
MNRALHNHLLFWDRVRAADGLDSLGPSLVLGRSTVFIIVLGPSTALSPFFNYAKMANFLITGSITEECSRIWRCRPETAAQPLAKVRRSPKIAP